jgi:hypothetical protein
LASTIRADVVAYIHYKMYTHNYKSSLLKDMIVAGLINLAKNKIEIKINGHNAFIGYNKLSQPELIRLNDLLMSHKLSQPQGK